MSNSGNEDNTIISVGYPEKTPGTPESYREISAYMEFSGNALCALGDLMVCVDENQLEEFTVQGIGYLLKMLGNDVMNKGFEVMDIVEEARKQNETNQSVNSQKNIEVSQSRV